MISFQSLSEKKDRIAVVGLGYVGLPLAIHMANEFDVTGFDVNSERISELNTGLDRTNEVLADELKKTTVFFTSSPDELAKCRLIIVAVPTPIDEFNNPDLRPLQSASTIVGKHLVKGSCIAFESTVYPGATEEICKPILEKESGLTFGADFSLGYSPERINPGDREHTFDKIVKIVSGSDDATLEFLANVYGKVVKAGIHKASSIKVAEAAKVIENTQRDLNIALMNELSMIFDRMDVDTLEVLNAAGTKWNFLPFKPGLVGGHCIGVDPYYLTFKAQALKCHPEMILAGRRINDAMGKYVAEKTVKMLITAGKQVLGSKIALLGLTFKENVPDLRNTRTVDIVSELEDYGARVLVHDPMADAGEAMKYYGITLHSLERLSGVDAVIIAVSHKSYMEMGLKAVSKLCTNGKPIVMDLKGMFDIGKVEGEEMTYWRL